MRVLQVIPCYLPALRYGGPVQSVHQLSRTLVKLGVDVTVFSTNADGPDFLDVPVNQENMIDGVKIHYFPVKRPRSYFRSPTLSRALREQAHQFDLVHINWLYVYPTLVAARHCISQKIPYLLAPRGMLDSNAIEKKGTLKKRSYIRLLEKRHICAAKALHFTSAGERDGAVCSEWGVDSYVVANGLDLEDYRSVPNSSYLYEHFPETRHKKLVLFLGRINYIKGLDLLAEAWPRVIERSPEAHLIVAGPDSDGYKEKIDNIFKANGSRDSVTFTGTISGGDKLSVLAEAHVLVAPSYLESFGISIVEAMASRKPVVVTDRVCICDKIKLADAGIITECDSEQIANALCNIVNNPRVSDAMGENGYNLVEREFTWQNVASEMIKVYDEVVRK